MNVLVTGATGFVGRNILSELHRTGHRVAILARDVNSRRSREVGQTFHAELQPGDILDVDALNRACAGRDAVIHLVGIISEAASQTFENIHTAGTRNVVQAAIAGGVKRFVHMSASGTRANAVARYHRSKWAAEEAVRASGLDWTILRPSIIYGPGDGFVNLFAKFARRSPVVPIVGSGSTRFRPIPVETVASAFVRALNEPRAVNREFDLAGEEVFTLNEIVDAILAATGRKRIKLHLPISIARVQAAILEFLFAGLLRRPPPLNRDQITMLREDDVGNPAPAKEVFGLQTVSFREGIARYLHR